MNKSKENFQIVDEHWKMFGVITEDESYKILNAHADELGKTMKAAFANILEIQKILNEKK